MKTFLTREEYQKIYEAYSKREDFIQEVQKQNKDVKRKTINNRWNLCNNKINPKISYIELYSKYPKREEFIRETSLVRPNIKHNSIIRRWQELKQKSKGLIKEPVTLIKYANEDKEELDNFRRLLFDDIKKYKKPRTREYLMKYGFLPKQINKLDEDGELDGTTTNKQTIEEDGKDL
jgi:hypothetical protein